MKRREVKKRAWQLEIRDDRGDALFEVPFAAVDPTLDHLDRPLRQMVEQMSDSRRKLAETVFNSQLTLRQMKAMRARAVGRPHLAAEFGHRI